LERPLHLGVGVVDVFLGGFKQSGVGREWSHHGIEEFTELESSPGNDTGFAGRPLPDVRS